jgi:hypothetical protein
VYTCKEEGRKLRKMRGKAKRNIRRLIILTFCSFLYGKIGNFAVKISSTLASKFLYTDITKILDFTIP